MSGEEVEFARVTYFTMDLDEYETTKKILDRIKEKVRRIKGLRKTATTLNRVTGEGVTIAIYPNKKSLKESEKEAEKIWNVLEGVVIKKEDEVHEVIFNI